MGKEALLDELFAFESISETENKKNKIKKLLNNMQNLKSGINLFYNITENFS